MGVALIIFDLLTIRNSDINNGGDLQARGGGARLTNYESGTVTHSILRAGLWAGLGAGSGVVGTIIWYISLRYICSLLMLLSGILHETKFETGATGKGKFD